MNTRLMHSIFLLAVCAFASPVVSQNFFWSEQGLGEGAVNGPLVIDAEVGDTGTVFLYYSPNDLDIRFGIDFDFSWETTGVVGFTSAETLDFDITIQDIPIDRRWADIFGPAATVTDDAVAGFLCATV